jgi:hypothetical protein
MNTQPMTIGLKKSFGFGDRLGLATPGHMDAVRGSGFTPIFAQQSIRELARTGREPDEVMDAAVKAVESEKWSGEWGADADHLQTRDDVKRMAAAGFTFFTIDPSEYVNNDAGVLSADLLAERMSQMKAEEAFDRYFGEDIELDNGSAVGFHDKQALQRAIIKYGAALDYTRQMYAWIEEAVGELPFEVEMSVDETDTPTSPLEHLYIGLELKRMRVKVVSLAPRFVGDFEKGIDYKGDLSLFERDYAQHVAIARYCGPYKLSIHSGSDKFSIYPIIGRLSGELLHVKTAGTSYLEALRVVARTDKTLFREIVNYSRTQFDHEKASYHISAELNHIPEKVDDVDLEKWYLDHDSGRQILHVTFGSVLNRGKSVDGAALKTLLLDNLTKNDQLYRDVLKRHLGKHIELLNKELE